jgi:hypothetical protein
MRRRRRGGCILVFVQGFRLVSSPFLPGLSLFSVSSEILSLSLSSVSSGNCGEHGPTRVQYIEWARTLLDPLVQGQASQEPRGEPAPPCCRRRRSREGSEGAREGAGGDDSISRLYSLHP